MSFKKGKNCKVSIGSDKVVGIGTWSISGMTSDMLEDTEFGDAWKTFQFGLKDGGTIAFEGLYDPDDATGQDVLRSALENDDDITTLRLYVDNTSYWTPKTTSPTSKINVTAWDIKADKSGLMAATFSCKISGAMELI